MLVNLYTYHLHHHHHQKLTTKKKFHQIFLLYLADNCKLVLLLLLLLAYVSTTLTHLITTSTSVYEFLFFGALHTTRLTIRRSNQSQVLSTQQHYSFSRLVGLPHGRGGTHQCALIAPDSWT